MRLAAMRRSVARHRRERDVAKSDIRHRTSHRGPSAVRHDAAEILIATEAARRRFRWRRRRFSGGAVEPWQIATLLGWATISAVMVVWVWLIILRLDAAQTAEHAGRKDPSAGWTHVLLLCASVASLAAVAFVFARAGGTGTSLVALVALGVASIALSWTLVHTMFTLHYARLYYSDPGGGIDFNQEQPPCYHDFAYVAFTVGMTFQVSDTDLRTPAIRHTALRHALLSYLFGSIILAGTINLEGYSPRT
jgi:uncharacterized membrane protein